MSTNQYAEPHTQGATSHLLRDVLRACRQRRNREKIVDTTGARLTGGELLTRALVLRRLLRRHVLGSPEPRVGLLLPPSAAAVVANLALALDRRVPVNLNYTLTSEQVNHAVTQAGITHILTSCSRRSWFTWRISGTGRPPSTKRSGRSSVTWRRSTSWCGRWAWTGSPPMRC